MRRCPRAKPRVKHSTRATTAKRRGEGKDGTEGREEDEAQPTSRAGQPRESEREVEGRKGGGGLSRIPAGSWRAQMFLKSSPRFYGFIVGGGMIGSYYWSRMWDHAWNHINQGKLYAHVPYVYPPPEED